jgi:hypothetical protein
MGPRTTQSRSGRNTSSGTAWEASLPRASSSPAGSQASELTGDRIWSPFFGPKLVVSGGRQFL